MLERIDVSNTVSYRNGSVAVWPEPCTVCWSPQFPLCVLGLPATTCKDLLSFVRAPSYSSFPSARADGALGRSLSELEIKRGVLFVLQRNGAPLLITGDRRDEWTYEVAFEK